MNKKILSLVFLLILTSSIAEARIGGGRSFGSRGSRGFGSSPSYSRGNSYSRPSTPPSQPNYSQPYTPPPAYPSRGSSFMKSLGAGVAGGFLGSMLFRSLGGGGNGLAPGMGGTAGSGGGLGLLEILLIGGALFLLIRYLMNRSSAVAAQNASWRSQDSQNQNTSNTYYNEPASGAEALMRQAKSGGWSNNTVDSSTDLPPQSQLDPETASDLFFRIQASWGSRDLTPVSSLLDEDAQQFLNQQINVLKNNRQFNRLENIAIRNVDVVEAWRESQKDFSTVRFLANVLDYTVSEDSQQVVEGSKTTPVKFEEYWTFSKGPDSSTWKLSAIQQS